MNHLTIGAFFSVAICCAGAAGARGVTDESSTRQTLHFTGNAAHTLEVRNINGPITVEAYDGQDVEMVVNRFITADSESDLRAAQREVTLDQSDNAATVGVIVRQPRMGVCGHDDSWSGRWPRSRYDVRFEFTVRVPRDTRLQLCSINKSDIAVEGTRADFEIRSINGRITMTDMGGSGEATTINGRVTASFIAAPRATSLFKTINGDVVVSMPDRLDADLHMKTFNGGLYTDFEAQRLPAKALDAMERHDGLFVYRSNDFTSVRVGNGGPELTLETLNGDVRVLRRSN
jgi:hypothetical protein